MFEDKDVEIMFLRAKAKALQADLDKLKQEYAILSQEYNELERKAELQNE